MENRKVCFFVSCGKAGMGGHHYSVRDLGNELKNKYCNVIFLTTGEKHSLVLKEDATHIKFNPFSIVSILNFRSFFKKHDFDAVFCFDETSSRIAIISIPDRFDIIVPVKPGWINSKSWTGRTNYFICFSRENFDFMRNTYKYRNTNINLIPNRVKPIAKDIQSESYFREFIQLKPEEKLLLIIARIDPDKKSVFEQGLNLFIELRKYDPNLRAVIAGIVNNNEIFRWLKEHLESFNEVHLLTDNAITDNISRFFNVANYIVAMGRTAMEAMSLGKLVFIPLRGSKLPLLLTEDTFAEIARTNFTYRTSISREKILKSDMYVHTRIQNKHFENELSIITNNLFEFNLGIEIGIQKYTDLIDEIKKHSKPVGIIKSFFVFWESYSRLAGLYIWGIIIKLKR